MKDVEQKTASQVVREAGLESFNELVELTNKNSRTLHRTYHSNPQYFACIVAGAVAFKDTLRKKNSGSKVKESHV